MSSQKILILTVLVIVGINNSIQAVEFQGEEIPPLDIQNMTGEWFLVASSDDRDLYVCMSNFVERNAEKNFTMYLTSVLKPDTDANDPNLSEKVYEVIIDYIGENDNMSVYIMKNTSDSIFNSEKDSTTVNVIITIYEDLSKEYLVVYTSGTASQLINGSDKLVFVFCREKIWSDSIANIIEEDDFYRQNMNPSNKLVSVNSTMCHS